MKSIHLKKTMEIASKVLADFPAGDTTGGILQIISKLKGGGWEVDFDGETYSKLTKYALLVKDVFSSKMFAQEAEKFGWGMASWFNYGEHFSKLNLGGALEWEGYSTWEETIKGYQNLSRFDPAMGYYSMGAFHQEKDDEDSAIKYFLLASKSDGSHFYKKQALKRLPELLMTTPR